MFAKAVINDGDSPLWVDQLYMSKCYTAWSLLPIYCRRDIFVWLEWIIDSKSVVNIATRLQVAAGNMRYAKYCFMSISVQLKNTQPKTSLSIRSDIDTDVLKWWNHQGVRCVKSQQKSKYIFPTTRKLWKWTYDAFSNLSLGSFLFLRLSQSN